MRNSWGLLVPRVSTGDGKASHSVRAISLQVFEPLTDVAEGALVKALLVMVKLFFFRMTNAFANRFVLPARVNISW